MDAILIGSTGLVGTHILESLLADQNCQRVLTITRRPQSSHPKLINLIAPDLFLDKEKNITLSLKIKIIEVLKTFDRNHTTVFCTLGTTIKDAGSRSQFYEIDHDLVIAFANLFRSLEIPNFLAVSAMGADVDSSIFYNHVKGETEKDLKDIGFSYCAVFRPSLLLGQRKTSRPAEKIAGLLTPLYSPLLVGSLKKFKPIEARKVAAFMLRTAQSLSASLEANKKFQIFENEVMNATP